MSPSVEIERVLTLSTAHMPSSEPDFGTIRVSEHDYGYILFLRTDEDRHTKNKETQWLTPLIELASAHNCLYINFDAEVSIIEHLPHWDW